MLDSPAVDTNACKNKGLSLSGEMTDEGKRAHLVDP